ncbi:MAG: suppressor of fused domain protein [Proteobacteria bacterium]|nr:suppressor of fused domain protein [Pseudomonadota bacterium]
MFLPANPDKTYQTLVTSGVSDRPMAVPEGMEDFSHAELLSHYKAPTIFAIPFPSYSAV